MENVKSRQEILVFPTEILRRIGMFQGFNSDSEKYLSEIQKHFIYRTRGTVEEDTSFKQVIPYLVMVCRGKILRYKRGALLSEKRLVGNLSIGIGGHIERQDNNLFSSIIEEAGRREMLEEVIVSCPYKMEIVGILNDDSNPVGKVHFGVIIRVSLTGMRVKKNEKSINEVEFIDLPDLLKNMDKFESWSKICLNSIHRII